MSQASKAMVLAGDYRADGYDPSTALEMAWDEVKGTSKRKRNPVSKTAATSIGAGTVIIVAIAGYILYYYWKNKRFPWDTAPVQRRLAQFRRAPQVGQAPRPQQIPAQQPVQQTRPHPVASPRVVGYNEFDNGTPIVLIEP